jgi:hypothetical protein
VTKTPGESRPAAPPEYDVLEELGDDAIIAQQAAVHSPQPRAQVAIESRSIVIAEERPEPPKPSSTEGEPTRELLPYAVSSVDPTVVIRDRKFINSLGPGPKKQKTSSVTKIAIWGGAGLVAFAIGGVLAVLTARRPTEPAVDGALQHSGLGVQESEPLPALGEPSLSGVAAEQPSAPQIQQEAATTLDSDAAKLAPKIPSKAGDLPAEKSPERAPAQVSPQKHWKPATAPPAGG